MSKPFTFASCYVVVYQRMCERSRELGYALTLHGSLNRDLDIVAIPWTEGAVDSVTLASELLTISGGYMLPIEFDDEYHLMGCPGAKPHGRLTWCFFLGGQPYIDLSVMPRSDLYWDPPFVMGADRIR